MCCESTLSLKNYRVKDRFQSVSSNFTKNLIKNIAQAYRCILKNIFRAIDFGDQSNESIVYGF